MLIKGQCREAPPLACFYAVPTEEHIFEGAIKWHPPLRKRRWAEPGGV